MSSFNRAKFSFISIRLLLILEKLVWNRFFDRAELDPNHAVVLFHGEGLLFLFVYVPATYLQGNPN
jgi:hypothetical protein